MPEPPIWDDVYDGPRWTYGLQYRPVSSAALPKGWIIKSNRPHERFAHGTVDFPRQLRAGEVAAYELTLVNSPRRTKASGCPAKATGSLAVFNSEPPW